MTTDQRFGSSSGLTSFAEETIASQGYAACFEELELGLHAVAVPVRGHRGQVVAAMSASGPSYRLSRQRVEEIVPAMSAAAADLSSQLGYFAD